MTWREKLVVRILLLVAKMMCEDASISREIERLSTTVYTAPKPTEELAA
jgi:hypothetical protein